MRDEWIFAKSFPGKVGMRIPFLLPFCKIRILDTFLSFTFYDSTSQCGNFNSLWNLLLVYCQIWLSTSVGQWVYTVASDNWPALVLSLNLARALVFMKGNKFLKVFFPLKLIFFCRCQIECMLEFHISKE